MSCSNQIICYTSPHLSLHVPFFFLLIILTHCYVIVYSFYYPPLQAYLQYKKSFNYISNPSCVGLITALCSLSNSNIVISFLIMLIGTLLYKSGSYLIDNCLSLIFKHASICIIQCLENGICINPFTSFPHQ